MNNGTTLIVIGLFFILTGAAIIYFGLKLRKQAARAKNWPEVTGQVTYVNMVEHTQKQEHRDNDGFKHASTRTTYEPVVRYTYTLQGSEHSGDRICIGATQFDKASAYAMLGRYTNGAAVRVYYNPDDPGEAVLEANTPGGTAAIFTGSFLTLLGLGLLLSGILS